MLRIAALLPGCCCGCNATGWPSTWSVASLSTTTERQSTPGTSAHGRGKHTRPAAAHVATTAAALELMQSSSGDRSSAPADLQFFVHGTTDSSHLLPVHICFMSVEAASWLCLVLFLSHSLTLTQTLSTSCLLYCLVLQVGVEVAPALRPRPRCRPPGSTEGSSSTAEGKAGRVPNQQGPQATVGR